MFSAVLAAMVLFAQASPAATPTPTPDPGKAVSGVTVTGKTPQSEEAQANTVVCHDEPVLNSRFTKRICATRRENADRKKSDQDVARDFQRSILTGAQPH